MKTPFIIFIAAVGLYAALTLPALVWPPLYLMSLFYVVCYGWFAWAVFTICSLLTERIRLYYLRMGLLTLAVPLSVAFAFQMIEAFNGWDDVWHSGEFLLFPLAATIAGWLSLAIYAERYEKALPEPPEPAQFN